MGIFSQTCANINLIYHMAVQFFSLQFIIIILYIDFLFKSNIEKKYLVKNIFIMISMGNKSSFMLVPKVIEVWHHWLGMPNVLL